MTQNRHRTIGVVLILCILFCAFGKLNVLAAPALAVKDYQLVKTVRVDRYKYQFEYKLEVSNNGSQAYSVTAQPVAAPAGVLLEPAELSFGQIDGGQARVSATTFSLVHDRRNPFSAEDLQWRFEFKDPDIEPVLSIENYTLVQSRRITRFTYEYTYRAALRNRGAPISSATANLGVLPNGLTGIDTALGFGAVDRNGAVLADDTFIVRHERRQKYATGDLRWDFDFVPTGTVPDSVAIAKTQTLDEAGHPLGQVQVETLGGAPTLLSASVLPILSDPESGLVNLARELGTYSWRFSKADYLPVWRNATLINGSVSEVPSPWLTRRNESSYPVTVLNGGTVGDASGPLTIDYPPGRVGQNREAKLTLLNGQSLPGFLPIGWSPVLAFWLEFHDLSNGLEDVGGIVNLSLPEALHADDLATFAKWNESDQSWVAVANIQGDGGTQYSVPLPNFGAYVLVLPDTVPAPPPAVVFGEKLESSNALVPSAETLSATGNVLPAVSGASLDIQKVTAKANVQITGTAPIPSGLQLRSEIDEHYELIDQGEINLPRFSSSLVAYQRPGDLDPRTVSANFPLQPRLLFSSTELKQATILAQILPPEAFSGGVIGSNGGRVANATLSVTAAPNAFAQETPVELRILALEAFLGISNQLEIVAAFELLFVGLLEGQQLIADFGPQENNASYVLAKVVTRLGTIGLQPIARYASDDTGKLIYLESSLSPSLDGITDAGRFVLIKVLTPQTVVAGQVSNSDPALIVQIADTPWLTTTSENGEYKLIAGLGSATVIATNLSNGDIGEITVDVEANGAMADVDTINTGPRIVISTPFDGELGVNTITPITIDFSEPLAQDSFSESSVSVKAANDAAVVGAISLNQARTRITFLSEQPLRNSTEYIVEVAPNITDDDGRSLEGNNRLTFATEAAATRELGAQLISYEPGSTTDECVDVPGFVAGAQGISCVVGTQGAADAEVPVIIINDDSGETATVLSKPDGSFKTFVNADVDDFISATFINANGTRINLPLSRQLFDDGQVALFPSGGILQAENEEAGRVAVLVEPQAVPNKTKFDLEPLSLNQLLAFAKGTLPEEGQLIGGLKLTTEGDELVESADISLDVDPATLDLESGEAPEDRVFALVTPIEVDGVTVYQILDKAEYDNGKVITASPPFGGVTGAVGGGLVLAMAMMPAHAGARVVVTGKVIAAPRSLVDAGISEAQILAGRVGNITLPRVSGAVVSIRPCCISAAGLRTGAYVGVTNTAGFYAMLVSADSFAGSQFVITAQSIRYTGDKAKRIISTPTVFDGIPAIAADLVFAYDSLGASDSLAPQLGFTSPASLLPVDTRVELSLNLRDNASVPSITSVGFLAAGSVELLTGEALSAGAVTFSLGQPETTGVSSISVPLEMSVDVSSVVKLLVEFTDAAGNRSNGILTLRFGAAPAVSDDDLVASDPDDEFGPQVLNSNPGNGVITLPRELSITFSEPISRSIETSSGAVTVTEDSTGNQLQQRLHLSDDQTVLRITLNELHSAEQYSVVLNAGQIVDLAGNPMEESYFSRFSTPASVDAQLSEVDNAVSAAVHAGYSFSIDRANDGKLFVHLAGETDNVNTIASLGLPSTPRQLLLIADYSYRRSVTGPVERGPLLVVSGGTLGGDSVGQWLWVIDIKDPTNPQRLSSEIAVVGPAASIGTLRFSAPYIALHSLTAEGSVLQFVNLQAFILAESLGEGEFADTYERGLDANGDGDFVDMGDELPLPEKRSLFGLEAIIPIATGRILNDFSTAAGTGFVVGTMPAIGSKPSRLQVLNFAGSNIGNGNNSDGAYIFNGTNNAFRVTLLPSYKVRTSAGIKQIPVAMVAVGAELHVVDISDPIVPSLAGKLTLPTEINKIFSLSLQAEEIVVGTDAGIAFLDPSQTIELGETVDANVFELLKFENTGRTFGANEATVTTVYGGQTRTIVRQPKIKVVTMPASAVQSAADIATLSDDDINELLLNSVENPYILPAPFTISRLECDGTAIEWLLDGTPNPAYHHYAVITASGTLGETFKVAVESLGFGGELHHSLGKDYPPIMLTDVAEQLDLDEAQREVGALTARRLSNDPNSELYNKYLTSSFVALRTPITDQQIAEVKAVAERDVIWSGHYLRFSFDAQQTGSAELIPFNSQTVDSSYRAATTKRYPSIPGEFIDNPNPSFRSAAPRHAGVDLQSGEYRHPEVDIRIAGRTQELLMARIYESRHRYIGPFGRGWDFNWNARIVQLPKDVPPDFSIIYAELADGSCAKQGPGDVLLIDGAGKVLRFTPINADNDNLDQLPAYQNDPAIATFFGANADVSNWTFYQSPDDEFVVLFKVSDGRWLVLAANGARTWFHTDGRLERIISPFEESVMQVEYRPDGRIGRVIGDRGIGIEFGYYKKFFFDTSFGPADVASDNGAELGRIARIRSTNPLANNAEVNYEYDADGNLEVVRPRDKPAQVIVYDTQQKHLIRSIGNGDSTSGFSQQLSYDAQGLVSSTVLMGQPYSFTGAVPTARDRRATGDSAVTISDNANVSIEIDDRGRPTMFANRPFVADDAGRVSTFADEQSEHNIIYDVSNPIYRFRGNPLRTEELADGEVAFTTHYEYDQSAFNRLTRLTDPNGVVTELDYPGAGSGSGQSSSKVSTIGGGLVRTTSNLNEFGQVLRSTKQAGDSILETDFAFSSASLNPDSGLATEVRAEGAISKTTNRDVVGRVTRYRSEGVDYNITFDDKFDLPKITNGGGVPSVTHDFDDQGRIESTSINAVDKVIVDQYEYDNRFPQKKARLTHQESGMPAQISEYFYDEFGRLSKVSINGEDTEYTYDGMQTTGVDSPGAKKIIVYDGIYPSKVTDQGLDIDITWEKGLIKSTTSKGAETVLMYDAGKKRPAGKTIEDSNFGTLLAESFFYDAAGRLQRVLDESGRERTFTFFANGDVQSMAINGLQTVSSERDKAGRTVKTVFSDTQLDFDNFATDGTALSERLTLLGSGRTIQTILARSNSGRTITESIAGDTWITNLDGFSNLASTVDPDGVVTAQNNSPSGHVLSSTFSDGKQVQYSYDQHWRVDSISAPGGTLDFTYTDGLATSISYPDGSSINYSEFNDAFEPERAVFGDVVQTLSWRDGRLVELTTNKGDELKYKYDGLGQTREISFNGFKVDYGFNAFGDSVSESTPLGSWELEADVRGHVSEETYPSDFSLTYSADTHGRPIAIPELDVTSVSWLGVDTWEAVKLSSGLCLAREYDNRLRTTKILYGSVSGDCSPVSAAANAVAGFEYEYTSGDRIVSEYRSHEDRFDIFGRNSPSEGMRITDFAMSATDMDGNQAIASVNGVSFDSFGEITQASSANGNDVRSLNPLRESTVHRLDSINGVAVVHDDSGSIVSMPLWVFIPSSSSFAQVESTLTYDGLQMLRQVSRADGCVIDYERDGLGRIHRRTVTGPVARCKSGTTRYAWKGEHLIEEFDESASGARTLSRRYVYLAGIPVRVDAVSNGVTQSYTPLITVNGSVGGYIDASGALVEQIVYGPYGLPVVSGSTPGFGLSAIGGTLLFHGAWFDEATGLYQMGQRNLHPVLGRFLQRDNAYFVENTAFYSAFNGDPAGRVDARGTYSSAVWGGGRRLSSFRAAASRPAIFSLPGEELNKAYAAEMPWRSRANSELAGSMVNAASRALKYAAMVTDEETKAALQQAKSDVDALKTGLDGLQKIATATAGLLKERDALNGIRAVTKMASVNGSDISSASKLVARGDISVFDFQALDWKLIDHKGYRQARELANSGQRGALQSHSFKSRQNFISKRKSHLIGIGKGLSMIASLYLSRQAEGVTNPAQVAALKQSHEILNASVAALNVAEKATKIAARTKLSDIQSAVKGSSIKSSLFGEFMAVSAAFDFGMALGQAAIPMFVGQEEGNAYRAVAEKFTADGGFLTVFSGLLSDPLGWDEGAYAIQRFHDDGIKVFAPPNFNLIGGKRAALDQMRLQGLDAP